MSIEVVLAPQNAAELSGLLKTVYDPRSPMYEHWLTKRSFASLFAPDPAEAGALARYLRASGLVLAPSPSPFLIRASGSSDAISAALQTNLRTYRALDGTGYFSNASAVRFPAQVAPGGLGVVGLSDTVRPSSRVRLAGGRPQTTATGCEAPYPTARQLFDLLNDDVSFPTGYGAAPGCNGLSPAQLGAIYLAPSAALHRRGARVTLGLFELSAYRRSDVATGAQPFCGPGSRPKVGDVDGDGGPLHPRCPAADSCLPQKQNYSGDVEVDADIETQLAIAPEAARTLVYNAPNDATGQTELDEFARIANDDEADVVSSSWASCENDVAAGYVQAENVIFEQMALQGQSAFASAGDTGAFCFGSDGTILNLTDPAAQPWVTSVGGTSLGTFNPGTQRDPSAPAGVETVWNVRELCNIRAAGSDEGGQSGLFWCGYRGASGGGNSEYWPRPFYQAGPGLTTAYSTFGPSRCALAKSTDFCREGPDVSADADEYTPYAEYCTGDATTPYSGCAFSSGRTPAGWFGIGGTSLSAPLWSAIFADRDGFQGIRSGNANPLLYRMYDENAAAYFRDVDAKGHGVDNNGFFPTEPGYDLATGIGTPKISAIISGFPRR